MIFQRISQILLMLIIAMFVLSPLNQHNIVLGQGDISRVLSMKWSPNGTYIAVGSAVDVTIYDQNLTEIGNIPLPGFDMTWSPDSKYLLISTVDDVSRAQIYDVNSLTIVKNFGLAVEDYFEGPIDWSPNGDYVALPSWTEIVIQNVEDIANTTQVAIIPANDTRNITGIKWNPDGSMLANVGGDSTLRIWDTSTWTLINSFTHPDREIFQDLVWHPTEKIIATSGFSSTIELWNIDTGERIQTLAGHTESIYKLSWGSNSQLTSASTDGTIRIWDVDTGISVSTILVGQAFFSFAWSPDGTSLSYKGSATNLNLIVKPTANPNSDQTLIDNDNDNSEVATLDGSASNDSDGNIASYEWFDNGTSIATGVSPQVELAVGTHTITLVVTDNDGLVDMDEVVITVESK